MGGLSSERSISLSSGKAVLDGLLRRGYDVVAVDASRGLSRELEEKAIEIAFIALHGRWGEDGTVQGLLEVMGIPYTGPGVLGSAAAIDKPTMKLLLGALAVPSPAYRVYEGSGRLNFPLPAVVKPAREGSTIGISIVKDESQVEAALTEALKYDARLLIEAYVAGREITVGIVNGQVLPVIEVRPASGFYDFTAKYTKGMTEYLVPATLDAATEQMARSAAQTVWEGFQLAGCVRVDMILDNGVPVVIDINTSPGMTETSLVPKAWGRLGRTFEELVEEILLGAALKA